MVDTILTFLQGLPAGWATLIIAAIPVIEVRGSVPIAIELFGMKPAEAAWLSFVGSAVPAVLLPLILAPLEAPLRRHSRLCDRVFDWVEVHVGKRYTEGYRALGALGLTAFIAVPLPVTGVWTGSLAAWLFKIPKRWAVPAIMVGTAISTAIVTATTLGFFAVLRRVI